MKGTKVYLVQFQTVDIAGTLTCNPTTEELHEVVGGMAYILASKQEQIIEMFGAGTIKSIALLGIGYDASKRRRE